MNNTTAPAPASSTETISTPLISSPDFQKLADIFLDFYQEGKYSLDGVENNESTHNQRKSIKNDFKDHIYGDSKFRRKNGKDAVKIWPKYTLCLFEALIDADTKKVIDLRRKIKTLVKEVNEYKNRDPVVRKNEMDAEIARIMPAKVEEHIQKRIALADRMNARIPKYQATIDRITEENETMKECLAASVPRKDLEDSTEQLYAARKQNEELKKQVNKKLAQNAAQEDRAAEKAEAKFRAEKAMRLAEKEELSARLDEILKEDEDGRRAALGLV